MNQVWPPVSVEVRNSAAASHNTRELPAAGCNRRRQCGFCRIDPGEFWQWNAREAMRSLIVAVAFCGGITGGVCGITATDQTHHQQYAGDDVKLQGTG